MSATDELRRMLDERGVAHSDHYLNTTWRDGHGILHLAGEQMIDGGLLVVNMLTPEQAIAATLGNSRAERMCVPHGEWERLSQTQERRRMYCDCGYELGMDKRDSFPFKRTEYAPMPRFCPECGVKLVSKGKAVSE